MSCFISIALLRINHRYTNLRPSFVMVPVPVCAVDYNGTVVMLAMVWYRYDTLFDLWMTDADECGGVQTM